MAEQKCRKNYRQPALDDDAREQQIAEESRRKGISDFHPRDLREQEELRDLSRQLAHDI